MSYQPGSSTSSEQQRQQSALPEWMRNPPPARLTLGRRFSGVLNRRPAWTALQRRWWAWQDRQRLYQRFPIAFKIVAFFVAWVIATVLVLAMYGIFSLA
jgi:hypothetical protein